MWLAFHRILLLRSTSVGAKQTAPNSVSTLQWLTSHCSPLLIVIRGHL